MWVVCLLAFLSGAKLTPCSCLSKVDAFSKFHEFVPKSFFNENGVILIDEKSG